MTARDYELIAGVIRKFAEQYDLDSQQNSLLYKIADEFSVELDGTSKSYDRTEFLEACGVA